MTSSNLLIRHAGLTTAVGLDYDATCAAIRAGIDNFQEIFFYTAKGQWVIGAQVPVEGPIYGIPRLARLLNSTLHEVLDQITEVNPVKIPLLLVIAETARPGRLAGLDQYLLDETCGPENLCFHPSSRLFPDGRVGGAKALRYARDLPQDKTITHALIAGADTYLVAPTLLHLEDEHRLLTPDCTNGFLPGEATSCVVVTRDDGAEGLVCQGLGFGNEPAPISSPQPLRAEGLAASIASAMTEAGQSWEDVDYRITDISGEHYGFKEAALAPARSMRILKETFDFWHPADCIGEVGAAVLPTMLAVALHAARNGYAPGAGVLAHLSNDDGQRAAILLHYRRGQI